MARNPVYPCLAAVVVAALASTASAAITNLTPGGTASQSTTAHGGVASRAIDGNTNGNWGAASVTHTGDELNPFWVVNMADYGVIDSIILNNRTDCCGQRLSDVFVDVLNSDGDVVWTSPEFNDSSAGASNPLLINVDVPDFVQGKQVRVRLENPAAAPLSLAEVQVLGESLENIAFGKPTTQSSSLSGSYGSEKAVDGNLDNSNPDFTHTSGADTSPSWQVDLGAGQNNSFSIQTLFIHNREDCCGGRLRDITVRIYDVNGTLVFDSFDELGDFINPDNVLGGGVNEFQSGPAFLELDLAELLGYEIIGRYVEILRTPMTSTGNNDNDRVLTLGEVEVLGAAWVPAPAALPAGLALMALGAVRRRNRRA